MSLDEFPEEMRERDEGPEGLEAPPAERVSVPRTWLVAGIVGVVSLLVGGAIGYTLALTAFDRGVDEAVSEVSSQVAAEFAAMMQSAPGGVAEAQPTPPPSRLDDVSADDDPYLGPEDAAVVIVEFSDFR